jgi:hypothetical protein
MNTSTDFSKVKSDTWGLALHHLADAVLLQWTKQQMIITSLDLKMELRKRIGPSVLVIQTDVSKYLRSAMADKNFAWTDLYTSREKPVPFKKHATYLEFYVEKHLSPVESIVRKMKEFFTRPSK